MYKQLLSLSKSVTTLNLIQNYGTRSANILRNRYSKRKGDHTRLEYNESITVIPNEYAEQDEYLNEKRVSKFYEEKHKAVRQRHLKSVGIQIKKDEQKTECENSLKKRSADDLPVSDITDPYKKPMRQCFFCKFNVDLDYKNTQLLSQFISPITGFLFRHEITGLCWPKYHELEKTVKKSRDAGLMPYRYKIETFISDPRIVDGMKDLLKDIPNTFDVENSKK
jgi:ribosomal protein S18